MNAFRNVYGYEQEPPNSNEVQKILERVYKDVPLPPKECVDSFLPWGSDRRGLGNLENSFMREYLELRVREEYADLSPPDFAWTMVFTHEECWDAIYARVAEDV